MALANRASPRFSAGSLWRVSAAFPVLPGYLGARLRAIHDSLVDFESGVARLPSELGELLRSLRHELEIVVSEYEQQLAEAGDDAGLRSRVETRYLSYANVAALTADVLTMGTDPAGLPTDLHGMLADLFGPRPPGHVIVVRVGDNATFQTYPLWRPEQMRPGTDLQARLEAGPDEREPWLVSVFDVPRSFGHASLTQSLVISHELAHAQDEVANHTHREAITRGLVLPQGTEADDLTTQLVLAWLDEVLADLAAVRRLGAAAILVFAEYARLVQAYGYEIPRILWQKDFIAHPPAEVRLHFMFRALDALNIPSETLGELQPALEEWRRIADLGASAPTDARPEFAAADAIVRGAFTDIQSQAASMVPAHQAYTSQGFSRATSLAELLSQGIAPSDSIDVALQSQPTAVPDLFNAATLVRWVPRLLDELCVTMGATDGSLSSDQRRAQALPQLDALLARAIEGARVRAQWPPQLE